MNGKRNSSVLVAVVGGYVLYLAYELLKSLINKEETTMAPAVSILFIVFFVLAGGAAIWYAWKLWMASRKEERDKVVEIEDDSEAETVQKTKNEEKQEISDQNMRG